VLGNNIKRAKILFAMQTGFFGATLFSSRCAKMLVYLIRSLLFPHVHHLEYNNLLDILQRTEAHHEILYIPYIFLEQCNIPHIEVCASSASTSVPSGKTTFPLI
jgi:hypothetical protein